MMINQNLIRMLRDATNKQDKVLYFILLAFVGRVSIFYDQGTVLKMRLCLKSSPIVINP